MTPDPRALMILDTITAFVIATMMMLLNGAVLGAVHRDLPVDLQPSAMRWRVGTLLLAGGCVLIGVQRLLPPGVVLPVANGLLLAGLTLYWLAMRRFDGRDEPWWAWTPTVVGVFAVFWFAQVQPSLTVRVVIVSILWAGLLAFATVALWRVPQETVAASRRVLSSVFVLVGAVMLARGLWFLFGTGAEQTVIDNGSWVNVITPMVAAVLPVIGTTAFLLLCSERLRRQLERAASTDALTGLANRRTLIVRGEAWLAEARAGRRALSVAVVDVDHFKSVNDRLGHEVGDVALRHVASSLQSGARAGALAARLGGEEFVVLFEAADVATATTFADGLRAGVAAVPCQVRELSLSLTVSIGVATWREGESQLDELLRRADQALYRAKAGGRNRVEAG